MNNSELQEVLGTLMGSSNPADVQLAQQLANELGLQPGSQKAAPSSPESILGTSIVDTTKAATTGNNPGLDKATLDRMNDPSFGGKDTRTGGMPSGVTGLNLGLEPPALGPSRFSGSPQETGWGATVSGTATPGNYYGGPDPTEKGKGKGNATSAPAGTVYAGGTPSTFDPDLISSGVTNMGGITPVDPAYNPANEAPSLVDPSTLSGYEPGGQWAGMDPLGGFTSGDMLATGDTGGSAPGGRANVGGWDKGNEQGNTASGAGGGGMGIGAGNSGEGGGNNSGGGGNSSGGNNDGAEGGSGQGGVGGVGEGGMGTGAGNDRRKGGPINKSGSYDLHKGEHVMNPEAVDIIGHDKLAELNKFAMKAKSGQKANKAGRNGPKHAQDTEIAHVTPHEKEMLAQMSGGVKVNPTSGLKAFFSGEADSGASPNGGDAGADPGGQGEGMGGSSSPAGDQGGDMGGNTSGSSSPAGDQGGEMGGASLGNDTNAYGGGGIGTTEAFGGHSDWQNSQPAPQIYYAPQPQAPAAAEISNDIDKRIKDLETYQPIAYQGDWLRYAMADGTYGGAQHRFQRRTNDPVESNKNIYAADLTYDTNAWPNVPVAYGRGYPGQGIAGLTGYGPGQYTPLGSQSPQGGFTATGPYANLKAKSGYGIMGLV